MPKIPPKLSRTIDALLYLALCAMLLLGWSVTP